MSLLPQCPRCGRTMRQDTGEPALCPACLLQAALAPSEDLDEGAADDDAGGGLPYEIITLIDRGRHGLTYLAHPLGTTRRVALKIVEDVGDIGAAVARFRRWRDTFGSERHPGIGRLLDAGGVAGRYLYLASEFIAGSSLSTTAAETLSPLVRTTIIDQLIDTIEFAHARGAAHMNLDPSHVKMTTAGEVRAVVVGFGNSFVVRNETPDFQRDLRAVADILRQLGCALPAGPITSASTLRAAQ